MLRQDVYDHRFGDTERTAKEGVWRELTSWLCRFIDPDRPVLDIGCDRGYFIRHVTALERWASDIRDVSGEVGPQTRFVRSDGLALADVLPNAYFGTVFMSNYLEHLRSPDEVVEQLRVAARLLGPMGRVVILQPNIRLVGGRYWDFIDHRVALTDASLLEAAELAGFERERLIVRFLPYTTKRRLPQSPWLVRWYLRIPIAWRLLAGQSLYVGRLRR